MSITTAELHEVVRELFTALDKDGSNFLEEDEVRQIAELLHGKTGSERDFNDAAF
jgi:Ca2+-binding EF-hand superfamily protein